MSVEPRVPREDEVFWVLDRRLVWRQAEVLDPTYDPGVVLVTHGDEWIHTDWPIAVLDAYTALHDALITREEARQAVVRAARLWLTRRQGRRAAGLLARATRAYEAVDTIVLDVRAAALEALQVARDATGVCTADREYYDRVVAELAAHQQEDRDEAVG